MKYTFKRNSSIGAMDAESDEKYLSECFYDTGDLNTLLDCEEPRRIVVGRVGAGKSALIQRMKLGTSNAFEVKAEDLSLNHIANSDIIQFFEKAGVKLDIFYQLLWKHVFVVELLRRRYKVTEKDSKSHWKSLVDVFSKDPAKERALRYIEQWGDKFWQDTELRVKEFTAKLEEQLSGAIDAKAFGISLSAKGAESLSEETRAEVVHKAQSIVNANQVRELGEIVSLLADEIFVDPMNRYYLLIDRLDEAWVDDAVRYKLIRALIETCRSFQRVRSVKIVIAIREDLLRIVFDSTRDAGFQEEKYESLFLRLRWKKHQLQELVELRLNRLIREQYTSKQVMFNDVFKTEVRRENALDYLVDRSLHRPRDIISYINCCLDISEGKEYISPSAIQDAEKAYSLGRLRSLIDEWRSHYPNLQLAFEIIRGRPGSFKYSEITDQDLSKFMEAIFNDLAGEDLLRRTITDYVNNTRTPSNCLMQIFKILYEVSAVGIKPQSTDKVSWVHLGDRGITEGQYKNSSTIAIHKMLWRALEVSIPPRVTK
ncbi:ATPase [Paucibacter sp. JuS9]|uniref:P-loop ATPase, Sll1717 family n=1 Tax=Paucibacter sp. JuS9 TaxID=3228748 RepID=UPI003756A154